MRTMGLERENEVSKLLRAASDGDPDALNALLPLLYTELHDLAHRQRWRQNGVGNFETTALLHEAYLKLVRVGNDYQDRTHFLRTAAKAMRQILVDYARKQRAEKRGGGDSDATYDDAFFVTAQRSEEIIALDEALQRLAALSPRQSEVVNLRYFAGFTLPETAELLGISPATAWRDWVAAQAWLQQELSS